METIDRTGSVTMHGNGQMPSAARIICVIPARIGSTRLPEKPLRKINGIPLIVWVYRNAHASKAFDEIYIATDDRRIAEAVTEAGGCAKMTSAAHVSGTDRVYEVASQFPCTHIVNIQGDEPRIPGELLRTFTTQLKQLDDNSLLTIVSHATIEEKNNPNVVKTVLDRNNRALYFSRATIPYERETKAPALKHIGIYGYTINSIGRFCSFTQGELEQTERLEQLRALENGMDIHCMQYDFESIGIDTPEELERFRLLVARNDYGY
jgi:3-deoxy-manno-octulosonate cytidylyltransferase (CMP-KDO synthetase)